MGGFVFGDLGARDGVEEGGGVAGCFEAGGDEVYDVAVFGVNLGSCQYCLMFLWLLRMN